MWRLSANYYYKPAKEYLPKECIAAVMTENNPTGLTVKITRYEGYEILKRQHDTFEERETIADRLNGHLGVSVAQKKAMLHGALFGWNTPEAQPDFYKNPIGQDFYLEVSVNDVEKLKSEKISFKAEKTPNDTAIIKALSTDKDKILSLLSSYSQKL